MMESQDGGDVEKKVLPKGKGLKKWRRIQRRERDAAAAAAKDAFVEEDVHRFVKRESRRVVRRSGSTSPSNTSSRSSTAASAPKFPPPIEPTKKARASGVSPTSIFTINGNGGVPHFTFGDPHSKQQQRQDAAAQHLLADSLLSLQALHHALQQEIWKFEEIGKESVLPPDDSTCDFPLNPKLHGAASKGGETNSSGQVPCEGPAQSGSLPLEEAFVKIYNQAHIFERKLEEAMTMLKAKEIRVAELEGILAKRESGSTVQPLPEKCRAMEAELEDLFRHKIEAEIECLMLRKTSEELKVVSENQIVFLEAQNALIAKQNKIQHKLGDAECNNPRLDLSKGSVDSRKMNSRMCKYAFCFFVQLMLLLLASRLLYSQLWPSSTTSVPT